MGVGWSGWAKSEVSRKGVLRGSARPPGFPGVPAFGVGGIQLAAGAQERWWEEQFHTLQLLPS